jgi:oxidase EvaA
VAEDFRWLTLGQIHALLGSDSTVNMDIRTVLSTLPLGGAGNWERHDAEKPEVVAFRSDVREALSEDLSARHPFPNLLSWLTGLKCHYEMRAERVPLKECTDWKRTDEEISHVDGQFFRVVGVSVQARTREVTSWTQPMLTPSRVGMAALLVRRIGGVPHVLVQGKPQPGLFDFFEVGPTVQCVNADYTALPESEWPAHLRYVLDVPESQVRFSALLSEEGGRFYHRENRYQVIEVPEDYPADEGKNYRWVTPHQLKRLAGLANCVNVEARTLLTCLQSLW